LQLTTSSERPYYLAMDSYAVRRTYLETGGSLSETAARLGTSKQAVQYHIRKANKERPLKFGEGEPADREAVRAFQRSQLARVGIETP
jgi:transposase-like protein